MESEEGLNNVQPDEKTVANAGVNYAPQENTAGLPAVSQEPCRNIVQSAMPPNIPVRFFFAHLFFFSYPIFIVAHRI